ncbi:MAG TPA: flagellar basal body P-ring protein FlgI, partial [Verrucomicrobiae bacterium]|nr:flagellar basal body P-ring protein FlgI [Verrucomicrobiae bacterium]
MASRIKDLVMISGARDNQLVGYGLVVGLAGDGDKDPV